MHTTLMQPFTFQKMIFSLKFFQITALLTTKRTRNVVVTTYFFDFRAEIALSGRPKMTRPAVFWRAGSGDISCSLPLQV